MRSVLPEDYRPRDKAPPVQGTRGHQMAMYVVYQNHLPMLADSPSEYRGQAGLEFLVRVPTTWDEMRVLHAEMGSCLVVARRSGDEWYVGGMTADDGRALELPLGFLGDGRYEAELYVDDPAGGPDAIARRTEAVSSADTPRVAMPRAGGFAARLARSGPDSRERPSPR
jgi:alpha-glucosidase